MFLSFASHKRLMIVGLVVASMASQPATAAGGKQRSAILKLVPADAPVVLIATNLEKTDQALAAMMKRIDPDASSVNLLAGIKEQLEVGDWIDFSKPFAMVQPEVGGNDATLFFAHVPDFESKIKGHAGATKKDGAWVIVEKGADGQSEKPSLFLLQKGDIVVGATKRAHLDLVGKGGGLRTVLKKLPKDIAGRDFLVHVNMEPLRQTVVGTVSMYGPMMAMMAGAQGGGDPAMATAMVNAMVEGVLGFLKQLATLDVAVDFSVEGIGATVASRFVEGDIKSYLAKQQPAKMPLLATIADQPYTMAFGYHMPGKEGLLASYLLEKMINAFPKKPQGEGDNAKTDSKEDGMAKAVEDLKEFYGQLQGGNVLFRFSEKGIYEAGDVTGSDPAHLLAMMNTLIESSNDLMPMFGMGMSGYKSLGKKTFGKTETDTYSFEIDKSNPAAAQAASMLGGDAQLALAVDSGRLRFGFGSEADLQRAFEPVGAKTLASSKYAKAALSALPKRRNLVILIDPAGIMSMLSAMTPMSVGSLPPSEPFAISVSLAGEPARIDIHVPVESIRNIVKATAPEEPM